MTTLREFRCVPCQGGEPTLTDAEIQPLLADVPGWEVVEIEGVKRLKRAFRFKDFQAAVDFTNQVAAAAEEQQHHPRILLEWGRVVVYWWTHKINGLHRNDFIMAARTDALAE
jgi:4a-hydroxytetrahydrobiopterin dehydratase